MMMKKMYSNQGRKPMMAGGDTMRQKKSYGGSTRKKYESGGSTNMEEAKTTTATPTTSAASGMTQRERDSLTREMIRLENLQDENAASAEQIERLNVIYGKLGMSATPGRVNVDR